MELDHLNVVDGIVIVRADRGDMIITIQSSWMDHEFSLLVTQIQPGIFGVGIYHNQVHTDERKAKKVMKGLFEDMGFYKSDVKEIVRVWDRSLVAP